MDRGFYVAASAMMVGDKLLADVSNNIANVGTVGFKRDKATVGVFSNLIMNKLDENVNIGNLNNQVFIEDTFTDFTKGSLVQTKRVLDFSIEGNGFFKIEKNGEYLYTRDGSFDTDVDGNLVTKDGGFVMDKNNKRVNVKDNKEPLDSSTFMIVDFENKQTLKRVNGNYYRNEFDLSEESSVNSKVNVGFLESSNVDVSTEITELIKTQRFFQFNQKSMMTQNELLEEISRF